MKCQKHKKQNYKEEGYVMKLWHFTYYVDKNDPNSEIKIFKIKAVSGFSALAFFNIHCTLNDYDPFVTVFRCDGEVNED